MATFNKFQQFIEDAAHGVHDLESDQLVVALMAAAPDAAADAVLADITEISYTNLSSRNITTSASTQTTGTYKLTLTDLVLTASGAVATAIWWGAVMNRRCTNRLRRRKRSGHSRLRHGVRFGGRRTAAQQSTRGYDTWLRLSRTVQHHELIRYRSCAVRSRAVGGALVSRQTAPGKPAKPLWLTEAFVLEGKALP
jgi:hypothetical protein